LTGLALGNGTSAFSAYGGTSCTNQFPRSLSASGAATCASVSLTADITGTLGAANGGPGNGFFTVAGPATPAKTCTFPNANATALTDQNPVTTAQGGTGLTTATDDNVMVGNGTVWQAKAVPLCTDTGGNHLNYDTATNTFTCGTSGGASSISGATNQGAV